MAALFERLRSHGTSATAITYPGTEHWFAEPSQPAYQPEAARAAWEETLQFLRCHLGDTSPGHGKPG